jgi:hypothetical protein
MSVQRICRVICRLDRVVAFCIQVLCSTYTGFSLSDWRVQLLPCLHVCLQCLQKSTNSFIYRSRHCRHGVYNVDNSALNVRGDVSKHLRCAAPTMPSLTIRITRRRWQSLSRGSEKIGWLTPTWRDAFFLILIFQRFQRGGIILRFGSGHTSYVQFDPLHSRNGSGYNKDCLESAGFARRSSCL